MLSEAHSVLFAPFNILIVRCKVKWLHSVMGGKGVVCQ